VTAPGGRDRDAAGRDRDAAGRDRDAAGRDRDAAGRARNARPRDELGRPLPRSATPDGLRIPDDLVISPDEAAELGGRLLAEGRPFHAHEVFEAAWKSVPGPERELWRGLAQIAVGLTHARRGNPDGAVALLRRGAGHIAGFASDGDGDGDGGALVDAGAVAAQSEDLARRIEERGLAGIPPADLSVQLRS
jgi:uncharacterized protein